MAGSNGVAGGACISAQGPSYTMHPAPPLPPPSCPLPLTCLFVFRGRVLLSSTERTKDALRVIQGQPSRHIPRHPMDIPPSPLTLRVTGLTTWPFPGPQAARPYIFGKSRFSIFGIRFPPHLNTIHPSPVSSIPSIAPQITMSGLKITDFSVHGMSCTALLMTVR